jgi:hypothetical protein
MSLVRSAYPSADGLVLGTFPEMALAPLPSFPQRPAEHLHAALPKLRWGMVTLRSIDGRSKDRRREPRTETDLALTVWGVDTRGDRFLQEAQAHEISLSGALLSGLDAELRSGDVVGVLYAGKKARYRVVWVRHSGTSDKVQAAVQRLAPDACPWKDLLTEDRPGESPNVSPPVP